MRFHRSLLFLLLLPALTWAQPVLLPYGSKPKRPTSSGSVVIYRDSVTGKLMNVSKLGPPAFAPIDSGSLGAQWTGKFSAERVKSNTLYPVTAASMASVRAAAAQSVPFVVSSDPVSGGTFYYDPLDTTTPDDGAMTIVSANGWRYKRQVLTKQATPQMFGAKGDSITDDGLALRAWASYAGRFELTLPAGRYRTSMPIQRINMGAVTIHGAGQGQSFILVSGDCDGLVITNAPNQPNHGAIVLRDFEMRSIGTKSTGRNAIYVSSHAYRPGPVSENLSFARPAALAHEWTVLINYTDCLGTTTRNIFGQGYQLEGRTIGIQFNNTPGHPSYEHSIMATTIKSVNTGVHLNGATTGGFGHEGTQFTDCNFPTVGCGVLANTTAGSPYLGFRGVHIFSFGRPAIIASGYSQLFFNDVTTYVQQSDAGVVPECAVRLHNVLGVAGDIFAATFTNSFAAVKLTGSGGEVAGLNAIAEVAAATTTGIAVGAGYQGAEVKVKRNWTGNTTWGTAQAQPIIDSSGTAVTPLLTAVEPLPQDKSILAYSRTDYRPHFVYADQLPAYRYQYVGSTATVDPTLGNYVAVGNGSSNITITIDVSKMVLGQTITVKRYDNTSTGTVSLQTQDASRKVQDGAGSLNTATPLPATTGQRQMTFMYNGTHLEFIGY